MHPQEYGLTTGLYPIDGWVYDQLFRDGFTRIESDSWEHLIDAVRTFRINVGLPIGDPAAEVSDAIRVRSPQNDLRRSKSAPFQQNTHRPIQPLIERMKEHLITLYSRQVVLESQDTADKRTDVCAVCPQNIQWETSCGQCNDDIEYRGRIARRATEYHNDKKLRGCRLHGLLLKTGVFLSSADLPPRHAQAPRPCWIP